MSSMQTAIRIADRFTNPTRPGSIAYEGQLSHFITLAVIAYCFLGVWFARMDQIERLKPRLIHDVDVSFELSCAPPEPKFKVVTPPMAFTPFTEDSGSTSALAEKKTAVSHSGKVQDENSQTKSTEMLSSAKSSALNQTKLADMPLPPVATVAPTDSSAQPNAPTNSQANTGQTEQQNASSPAGNAGGTATGQQDATGSGDGTGTGKGDQNSLAGGNFGIRESQNKPEREKVVAMGNIGPYTRDLRSRIKQNWHPTKNYGQVTIEVTLDKTGKLVKEGIVEGSGDESLDETLIQALQATEFAPLPDWYTGNSLKFKIVLKES